MKQTDIFLINVVLVVCLIVLSISGFITSCICKVGDVYCSNYCLERHNFNIILFEMGLFILLSIGIVGCIEVLKEKCQ